MALAATPNDQAPEAMEWAGRPFYAETVALLNTLRNDQPIVLSHATDQLGVVGIDPDGQVEVVRDGQRLSQSRPASPSVSTEIEIVDFRSLRSMVMGSAAVEFVERRFVDGIQVAVRAIASVVWTQTPDGWRSAGFHITPLATASAS